MEKALYRLELSRDDFFQEVYSIVKTIPLGKVLTYGAIARLLGSPDHFRLVGAAMRNAPSGIPVWRVINSQGRTALGWPEQCRLLEQEGVILKSEGWVDLERCLWDFENIAK